MENKHNRLDSIWNRFDVSAVAVGNRMSAVDPVTPSSSANGCVTAAGCRTDGWQCRRRSNVARLALTNSFTFGTITISPRKV